jgi:hypothetical protein
MNFNRWDRTFQRLLLVVLVCNSFGAAGIIIVVLAGAYGLYYEWICSLEKAHSR